MPSTFPRRASVLIASVIVAALVLFALYTAIVLHWSYSEGERAGYLQKLSRKGWLCKTWEGEILLSSMPGAIPERFAFTVRDENVVKQLQSAMGQRVQLSYAQHVGLPTSCFGETSYFVEKAVIGGSNPVAPNPGTQ
ncbi:hypothetical protein ACFQ09_06075 [Massilia norwichensis]|uniref:6-phosphogluconate dehydrogenase n=1 Tax=Massilia norwichensis TaxID=1442366 RepID=A0ABT2ABH8_9BURK|nr:hypothetical protein [Massilia norwichensis]MCS0591544.1 hypothetical protein [Massilia norwichensis]